MLHYARYKFLMKRFSALGAVLLSVWLAMSTVVPVAAMSTVHTPGVLQTQTARPMRLRIPAIGVDAAIESVGKTQAGAMDVPRDARNVAWYNLGPLPGTPGNAVISGHLDDVKGPAVFYKLRNLKKGDDIIVTGEDNVARAFKVMSVESYAYDKAPVARIFGFDLTRDLNLITCGGTWNRSARNYSQRMVVYARLAQDLP